MQMYICLLYNVHVTYNPCEAPSVLILTHTLMQPCTLHVNLVKPKNLGAAYFLFDLRTYDAKGEFVLAFFAHISTFQRNL